MRSEPFADQARWISNIVALWNACCRVVAMTAVPIAVRARPCNARVRLSWRLGGEGLSLEGALRLYALDLKIQTCDDASGCFTFFLKSPICFLGAPVGFYELAHLLLHASSYFAMLASPVVSFSRTFRDGVRALEDHCTLLATMMSSSISMSVAVSSSDDFVGRVATFLLPPDIASASAIQVPTDSSNFLFEGTHEEMIGFGLLVVVVEAELLYQRWGGLCGCPSNMARVTA